jgi:hypothetical protein
MTLIDNLLEVQHGRARANAISQAATNLGLIARATTLLVLDVRLRGALSLGPRIGMASGMTANNGRTHLAIASSGGPDSSVDDGPTKPEKARRRHNSSRSSKNDSSFPDLKILLGIFASAYRSVVVSPSADRPTYEKNPANRDKVGTSPLADAKQSVARLLSRLATPFVPALGRALVQATRIVNKLTAFLNSNAAMSDITTWALDAFGASVVLATAIRSMKRTLVEPFKEGFRVAPDAVLTPSWLASETDFGATAVTIGLASYFVRGKRTATIVGLGVAGFQLYRHWHAAKRLLSGSIESASRTITHLMKWIADAARNAAAYSGDSIVATAATPWQALYALTTAHGLNSEHAGAMARSAPTLRRVSRAAAVATLAAPLMLAGAPANALAAPFTSTDETARIAAPLSPAFASQTPIVIDYSPNVVIHAENAGDTAALKRLVMEILERHGRELHQVLQREIIRQQRQDFQPRYSNQQG